MDSPQQNLVLILGAGINGCALARELVLNGVSVWVVDRHDIAFGATSRSSRLIHGGLRYLEYGDFRLVRESLAERAVLRKAAPQYVEPLRLFIPVSRRTGGLLRSALRFLGAGRSPWLGRLSAKISGDAPRGQWIVRMGLWMYDLLAAGNEFPRHSVTAVDAPNTPKVDPAKFRWQCAYADAQMRYPDRFVLAMLEDARRLAREKHLDFRVLTHQSLTVHDSAIELRGTRQNLTARLTPQVIVNATGAWGDMTLQGLQSPSPRLFGPTKGSHFISHASRFRAALGDAGIYAEADDGRLVFVLPFGESVLVGTTDERFESDPATAVAEESEIDYLLSMVNELFPTLKLTRNDIALHYCGVRPLPHVPAGSAAAITRDHAIVESNAAGKPVLTLVGGKLTTARAFAQLVADDVFRRFSVTRTASSLDRVVPGGEDYPPDSETLRLEWETIARKTRFEVAQLRSVWSLVGSRTEEILRFVGSEHHAREPSPAPGSRNSGDMRENLAGTTLPLCVVNWFIKHEWVTSLDDLVERRLMLVFEPGLCEQTLREAAGCLVETGILAAGDMEAVVQATRERLRREHGLRFDSTA